MSPLNTPALLAYPFRVFFLLAALFAALSVAVWGLQVLGAGLPPVFNSRWHAHEMLYGFVPAAIAGFLLTAISNWTGTRPPTGTPLAALAALWIAGRLAVWIELPPLAAALTDGAFLPVLALYCGRVLWRARLYRNLGLVAVLLVLATGNGLMHAGQLLQRPDWQAAGMLLGLDFISVLMVIIAGRITPAFTHNWLRARGITTGPTPGAAWLNPAAIFSIVLLALASQARLPEPVTGLLALAAAIANGARLLTWGGWRAAAEPLLWVLHLAYAMLVIALGLRAASLLVPGAVATPTIWYHALGVGGMGLLILGVMARVSVGHTGRPLALLRGGTLMLSSLIVATLARLAVAAGFIDYSQGLGAAALAWIVAFLAFAVIYGPILCRPRADGRPG